MHPADLRHGLVAFVHEDDRVLGKIVEQRRRRFPGRAAGQVARVVLDPVAVADLPDHLEVEHRPLVQPLGLEELALVLEERAALFELGLDRLDGRSSSGRAR